MYIPFKGFAPDLDPSIKGIIQDGYGFFPSPKGFTAIHSPINSSVGSLTGTAHGAASLIGVDGSIRVIAGTAVELFEAGASSWTDVTRAAGDYTAGTTWRFCQLGTQSIASNGAAVIQGSTSGAFSDLSGAPAASIVEAVDNQVFALNTVDAGFGTQQDRWWACALGNTGSWTPSIATQAASGRLTRTPGAITAGKRLGSYLVIYKEQSMYLGQYDGPPTIWSFTPVADDIGAVSHEAVISKGHKHYFMGIDDFFIFDGSRPIPIGDGIRQWFFEEELDADNRSKVRGIHDRLHSVLWWFYPSLSGTGAIDRGIPFYEKDKRWGAPVSISANFAFEYIRSTGPTYNNLGNFYSTYADLPLIAFNSTFWTTKIERVGIFNTSNTLQTLDGDPGTSSYTLGIMGADETYSYLSRVRPRFGKAASEGKMIHSYREHAGGSVLSGSSTASLISGKFDTGKSARWHEIRMDFTGDVELIGVDIDLERDGLE